MNTTAGTDIHPRPGYDPHITGQFFLTSVRQRFQFFLRRMSDLNRMILPYILICLRLDLFQHLFRHFAVHIQRDCLTSHVKSYVVITVFFMDQSADQMFAGVLLHQVKSALPVNPAGHFCPLLDRFPRPMPDFSVLFLYIHNFHPVHGSDVTWLSAPFRVKYSLIQKDLISFLHLSALQHFRLAGGLMGIFIK